MRVNKYFFHGVFKCFYHDLWSLSDPIIPECPPLSTKSLVRLHGAPLRGHRSKSATADDGVCRS